MIQLTLASPFWEDPSELTAEGEDEAAVTRICIVALLAAGYEVRVREGDELIPWDEADLEKPDA